MTHLRSLAVAMLLLTPAAQALGTDAIGYEIYVVCGAGPIYQVSLGVIIPQGTTGTNFGPGCTDTSCAGVSGLGATVDPNLSFALGPNILAEPGVREDTLYFHLQGSGAPDNRLCSAFEERLVAHLVIQTEVVAPAAPNMTTEGVAALGLTTLLDSNGRLMLPEEYAFVAQDETPVINLTLEPAVGDTVGHKWQIELESNIWLNRVTFGIVAPAGTTTANMRFTGCAILSGTPATRRSCTTDAALGPYVAPETTFTVGPGAAASGLRTDTLYVSALGNLDSEAALPALNVRLQPTLLGVVELDTNTIQPALTADGIGSTSVFPTPFVDVSGLSVPPQAVQIGGGYNAPSEYDGDGRSDDLDNCPFFANHDQADNGGLLTRIPNGRGDACECGDINSDGAVYQDDTVLLRELLTAEQLPFEVEMKCSVIGSTECDIRDSAILRRAVAGLGPSPIASCRRAVR